MWGLPAAWRCPLLHCVCVKRTWLVVTSGLCAPWVPCAALGFCVWVFVCAGTSVAFTKEGKLSSSFLVGSEGGGVYRCLLHNKGPRARAPGAADVKTEMRWNEEALAAVARIPQARVVFGTL